jgi:hypothetical protein
MYDGPNKIEVTIVSVVDFLDDDDKAIVAAYHAAADRRLDAPPREPGESAESIIGVAADAILEGVIDDDDYDDDVDTAEMKGLLRFQQIDWSSAIEDAIRALTEPEQERGDFVITERNGSIAAIVRRADPEENAVPEVVRFGPMPGD